MTYSISMSEIMLMKQKIEEGKMARLKEWMAEIRDREDEAIATLENEGMHSETAFIEQTDDGDYLIYYMKADDIDGVFEAFEQSSHDIDIEHQQVMKEVLESPENVGEYELLYHLENPNRP